MTRQELKFLLSQQEYPSVSITVSFAVKMPDRQGNVIKVKDAIKAAKEQLLKEFSDREVEPIVHKLQEAADLIDYTNIGAESVAIFANKNFVQTFLLPVPLKDSVIVDSIFAVRDVVWTLNRIPKYWVLALSEKPARLFYGVGQTLKEIIEPAQDALGNDQDGFPYSYVPPDKKSPHEMMGSNIMRDAKHFDAHKQKFVERVMHLADRFLKVEQLPFFVVCDEKNHFFFEHIAHHYPEAGWLHGDYCKRTAHGLAQAIWPVVNKYLDEQRNKKIVQFEEEAMGTKKHAFGMREVWRAAQEGRVNTLLVEENFSVAGIADPDNKMHIVIADSMKPGAVDLVNELIDIVLHKGEANVVFCAPGSLKKYEQVAAILRY